MLLIAFHLTGVIIIYQLEVYFALLLGRIGLFIVKVSLINEFIIETMDVYSRVVFVALFEEFLTHKFIRFEEVGVALEIVVVEESLSGNQFSQRLAIINILDIPILNRCFKLIAITLVSRVKLALVLNDLIANVALHPFSSHQKMLDCV